MPLQIDEDIVVFSNGKCNYYPIMKKGKMRKRYQCDYSSRRVRREIGIRYTDFSEKGIQYA